MAGNSDKDNHFFSDQSRYRESLGSFLPKVNKALQDLADRNIIDRIWEHDPSVWKGDSAEISNRLGWLHSPEVMAGAVETINAFTKEIRQSGYTQALLLGMGGSSLAAEVFRFTFGVKDGYLDLAVLDSTDPGAVSEKAGAFDPLKTLYIISTKSGTTVETFSFLKFFYNAALDTVGPDEAGAHFIAITDPGSRLEKMGRELNFRKIFLNDPHIGGRYSALSYFGLVPAALIGMDLELILERAAGMIRNDVRRSGSATGDNTAARLGATMSELAAAGRDKLTLITSTQISFFEAWLEQLIAESTGKENKGILPVVGETSRAPVKYGHERLFVYLRLKGDRTHDAEVQILRDGGEPLIQLNLRDTYDLGAEFFRWEMATAIAGSRMGINPFEQPNVESAKLRAREMAAAYQAEGTLPQLVPAFEEDRIKVYTDLAPRNLTQLCSQFLTPPRPGQKESKAPHYVALQAWLKPSQETDKALQELRTKINKSYGLAVTIGYGPRFLHSTGQLHKGDAGQGLFIQLTAEMEHDLPIPDRAGSDISSMTFGVLKEAQALGDRKALIDAKRQVIRFHLGKDITGAIKKLTTVI